MPEPVETEAPEVEGTAPQRQRWEVTREEYGEAWPFTVESGTVDCVMGQDAIFRTGGETYQLNGFATSRGFQPINP